MTFFTLVKSNGLIVKSDQNSPLNNNSITLLMRIYDKTGLRSQKIISEIIQRLFLYQTRLEFNLIQTKKVGILILTPHKTQTKLQKNY